MDVYSHHQNQGPTEMGQLAEGAADTPGHAVGKTETCYRAQRCHPVTLQMSMVIQSLDDKTPSKLITVGSGNIHW